MAENFDPLSFTPVSWLAVQKNLVPAGNRKSFESRILALRAVLKIHQAFGMQKSY
jgi:hypothetical protein